MSFCKRFFIPALLAVCAAPLAGAQTIQFGVPKLISALAPWTSDFDETRDVAVDDLGNRYVTGTMSVSGGSDGYVAKFNRVGVLQWNKTVNLGTADVSRAVAVDSANDAVYIGVTVDGVPNVQRYDGAGNLAWTSSFGTGVIHDLAVDPNGNVVSVGQHIQNNVRYSSIIQWASDGSGYTGNGKIYNGGGVFASVIIDETGRIYAAGHTDATSAVRSDVIAAQVSPDWVDTNGYTFGGGDNVWDDRGWNLAIDANGMLVFGGQSQNATTGEIQGFICTMDFAADNGYWSRFTDTDGSTITDIETAPDGMIYMAVTSGLTSANPFGYILGETKDPADEWFVDVWADAFDPIVLGSGIMTFNMSVLPGNELALACMDASDVASPSGNYHSYSLLSWASDGTRLQRTVMGSFAVPIPTSLDPVYHARFVDAVVFDHGYYSVFAPSQGAAGMKAAIWSGLFRGGPDDSYNATEETPLTVGTNIGLLKNDPNGWDMVYPNKARLVAGSASDGFASLVVRQNGTFDATFDPNFQGDATFQYEVRRNNVVVDTNTATIHVKNTPDAPVAVNDTFHVPKNSPAVTLDVLANDSDPDGDDITIFSKTNPASGRLTIAADRKSLSFKPAFGFTGIVSFNYTIKDTTGRKSTASVNIAVP
jgi:hypothetical protein